MGTLGRHDETNEELDALEALERESADRLCDLQSTVGGSNASSLRGSFRTAPSSPALLGSSTSPGGLGSFAGLSHRRQFRATEAYDQQMLRGSRSDAPRCANCGKEAQKAVEDLTQTVQPFRNITPGVPRNQATSAPVGGGISDAGVLFCDGECMWTWTLAGKKDQAASSTAKDAKSSDPAG